MHEFIQLDNSWFLAVFRRWQTLTQDDLEKLRHWLRGVFYTFSKGYLDPETLELVFSEFLERISRESHDGRLGQIETPIAWTHRVARNAIFSYWRAMQSRREHSGVLDQDTLALIASPSDPPEFDDLVELLHQLTEEEMDLLNRLVIENQNHRQVAAELEISVSAVATRWCRLRRRIRDFLSLDP